MVELGCFFFVCIARELAVHYDVGEVTADAMGVVLYYGVSILIIFFSVTVLFGGSFGFRRCGITTLFLMLKFLLLIFPSVCLLLI